ncbi:O-antigen ligase [Rubrivivax gelatinosus]|uniref:PglL family O-oligosaccharyltransferase n=1 Tax=Rubrivivax gelatinosus TaxID=28068 RepID=UPI0018C930C5|nr:O-antigen ligase family protein [Rubrivivax gelatinosus]MBG6079902.1 O-antigen ligase [Rubrivivax gelatinosus]
MPAASPAFIAHVALALLAACAPSLLAYNVSPSPTFLNQALAIALWGLFVAATAPRVGSDRRGAGPLKAALLVVLAGVCWSWSRALPSSIALSAIGILLAALVMVSGGAAAQSRADPRAVFAAFCIGWAAAGVFNVAIALVQVFAPDWADGQWIARSGIPGRAVGNLRQPNHLSSLLLWSAIAVVALVELYRDARVGRLLRASGAALFAALIFAVVLTASRTGFVGVLLLALWGVLDRRLARSTRLLLLAAPLVYLVGWLAMAEWARLSQHVFGGEARLAENDLSSSRVRIWLNTLELIRRQPWGGVGFGEFNFAWSLTPFPDRPVAFFDHPHNLVLQLAVELGVPAAALVMALLLWALGAAARLAFRPGRDGEAEGGGIERRAAWVMVLMIGLHSLLEYPLWYAYFLLPAAWAWGFALARRRGPAMPHGWPQPTQWAGGLALVVGATLAVVDYLPVTRIFSSAPDSPPLVERIAVGQRSLLFAYHADYAAATTGLVPGPDAMQPFEGATHHLLDTRLMTAWANALAAHGELDAARHIAERLREFRNPASRDFFAACDAVAAGAAGAPFQCQAPQRVPDWREFFRP